MKRKEDYPIQKVTINLRAGDMDFLQEAHPQLGAGKVIRELVRSHVERLRAVRADIARSKELQIDISDVLK